MPLRINMKQGVKNCKDLALNLLYNLRLGTYMKLSPRNNFLQPVALCPLHCKVLLRIVLNVCEIAK